ncbi:MAG: hypothetical protein JW860_03210 [Sedimentisphaerales bacterium]|nr:hypothetical protein [Sedimentisphaerales bacterium]
MLTRSVSMLSLLVMQGRLKIGHQFIGGYQQHNQFSPVEPPLSEAEGDG